MKKPLRRSLAVLAAAVTAGSLTTVATPASAATTWLAVSAGVGFTCGVTSARDLYCWGYNRYGQLGTGDTTDRLVPTRVGARGIWASVSAGSTHTCALDRNGVRYCWGRNVSGQLGLGDTTSRTQPTSASSVDSPETTWQMISAGDSHTCGIRPNARAYCWGSDFYGQLSNSDAIDDGQPIPQKVIPHHYLLTISTGTGATCGLESQGLRYCWGHNDPRSKLGLGKNAKHPITTATSNTGRGDWRSIDLRHYTGCAIDKDKRLYCWGENSYGEVGVGDKKPRYDPTLVSGNDWTQVTVGSYHTCGLKTDGVGYCWGSNQDGQLGVGNRLLSSATTPRVIDEMLEGIRDLMGGPKGSNKPPMTWSSLSAGRDHTCGIRTDGTLFCWGKNNYGQVGDGTTTTRSAPTEIA